MEGIGPCLCDVVDHAAHVAAVFRVEVRHHLQLSNRILIAKKERGSADGVIVVILPIDLKVIRAGALAVDR